MAKKAHITVFATMAGSAATLITPYRWKRQAATHRQSMIIVSGHEIWFSHARSMPEKEAVQTARDFADGWINNGCPSTARLREAVETGTVELFFYPD